LLRAYCVLSTVCCAVCLALLRALLCALYCVLYFVPIVCSTVCLALLCALLRVPHALLMMIGTLACALVTVSDCVGNHTCSGPHLLLLVLACIGEDQHHRHSPPDSHTECEFNRELTQCVYPKKLTQCIIDYDEGRATCIG